MQSGYVYLGNNVFNSLLAVSNAEQERGLMYQKPPTPVVSFIYPYPKQNRFWMSNTPSKLDIVFCCDNKVQQICVGEPYSTKIIGDVDSDLVIELPYGSVASSNINIGDPAGLISPKIADLQKIMQQNLFKF